MFRVAFLESLEAYSESSQASKMQRFANIINEWKLLTVSAERSILDIWLDSR